MQLTGRGHQKFTAFRHCNRDGQLRNLLTLETGVPMAKLESVRYYGGYPMSAHHVISGVKAKLDKAA